MPFRLNIYLFSLFLSFFSLLLKKNYQKDSVWNRETTHEKHVFAYSKFHTIFLNIIANSSHTGGLIFVSVKPDFRTQNAFRRNYAELDEIWHRQPLWEHSL